MSTIYNIHFFSPLPKTTEEINTHLNGLKIEDNMTFQNWTIKQGAHVHVPQTVDWRERDMVSPVQNQVHYSLGIARRLGSSTDSSFVSRGGNF